MFKSNLYIPYLYRRRVKHSDGHLLLAIYMKVFEASDKGSDVYSFVVFTF
jgi:hypothetical protein